jgi:tetratricopeptide (TPR) repeat protein
VLLAATLFRHLLGGHYADALALNGHARDATRLSGDQPAKLGAARQAPSTATGPAEQAADLLHQALRCSGSRRPRRARAALGSFPRRPGLGLRSAVHHYRQALALYQQAGDPSARRRAGQPRLRGERLGRYDTAVQHHEQALTLFREEGDRTATRALTNLGDIETLLGRHGPAVEHHRRRWTLPKAGDHSGEAWRSSARRRARVSTDPVRRRPPRPGAAFRGIGDRDGEPWALNGLGQAAQAAGRPAARSPTTPPHMRHRRYRRPRPAARAHAGIGDAYRALGIPMRAREHLEQALALYADLGARGRAGPHALATDS